MRVLVTNDDGINAPGLAIAEGIAAEIAGPAGEVWVVAPEMEQSGVGHCVSYVKPLRMTQLGPRRFMVEGAPADCVILGVNHILADAKIDLVLSGVNRGRNSAEDAVYSGTLGAAMEGALQGVRAVGLSQSYDSRAPHPGEKAFWSASRVHGPEVVRKLLAADIWGEDIFYNVNFPGLPADEVKGVKVAPSGRRAGPAFVTEEATAPNGRAYFWLRHGVHGRVSRAGGDDQVHMGGHISVTPMRPDLTAPDLLERAARAMDG